MSHSAKIIADSISPDGVRLTTLEVTFPRIVLAEFNTHRMLSRNSASSRAIPVEKMIRMVEEHPYIPTHWGKNQKGMQAEEEISGDLIEHCTAAWLRGRNDAVRSARLLLNCGVHKQITNRLLEPFMWHTCIVTATEFSNFFNLRCHPAAHPEIRKVAEFMHNVMERNEPKKLGYGDWHLPYVIGVDIDHGAFGSDWKPSDYEYWSKVSVGRCARVSYLTHDGKRDPAEDIRLHDQLFASGHMSPFEHVARPMTDRELQRYAVDTLGYKKGLPVPFCGNLRGWVSYRKLIPNEHDILGAR